jgi:hypothetical protein
LEKRTSLKNAPETISGMTLKNGDSWVELAEFHHWLKEQTELNEFPSRFYTLLAAYVQDGYWILKN